MPQANRADLGRPLRQPSIDLQQVNRRRLREPSTAPSCSLPPRNPSSSPPQRSMWETMWLGKWARYPRIVTSPVAASTLPPACWSRRGLGTQAGNFMGLRTPEAWLSCVWPRTTIRLGRGGPHTAVAAGFASGLTHEWCSRVVTPEATALAADDSSSSTSPPPDARHGRNHNLPWRW